MKSFLFFKNCGRAGLLHHPEQGSLAQYFKTKKNIKRTCGFFLFKMSCPEIAIHKKVSLWKNMKKVAI